MLTITHTHNTYTQNRPVICCGFCSPYTNNPNKEQGFWRQKHYLLLVV